MARPQVEDGSVRIALSLFQAIYKTDFTVLERKILDVVIDMTYGANKKSAEMSVHDIRYMLGPINKNRTDRIVKTVESLIAKKVLFKQRIDDERYILGVQKDFDNWAMNVSKSDTVSSQDEGYKDNKTYKPNTLRGDTTSPAESIVSYAEKRLGIKLSGKLRSLEQGIARELYQLTLNRMERDTLASLYMVKDYIDFMAEDKWLSVHVKLPMSYMRKYYERWLRKQPKKTRSVRTDEEITGYRFRYDVVKERWVRSADKLVRPGSDKGKPTT